jgi:hypothetical protein
MAPETGTMVFGRTAAPSMEAAEPRTLTLEELNYARVRTRDVPGPRLIHTPVHLVIERIRFMLQQAALHVLRTRTAEEAIRIFTDGLKPVRGIRVSLSSTMGDSSSSDDDVDLDLDPCEDYNTRRCGRHGWRRSFKRDVATAPF